MPVFRLWTPQDTGSSSSFIDGFRPPRCALLVAQLLFLSILVEKSQAVKLKPVNVSQ